MRNAQKALWLLRNGHHRPLLRGFRPHSGATNLHRSGQHPFKPMLPGSYLRHELLRSQLRALTHCAGMSPR
jgi:hypothetical protein